MRFKSIKGEWFADDESTKAELEAQGIDHLGIHVSEDPYIQNMEFVTGVSRRKLLEQQSAMRQELVQSNMMKMQYAQLLMSMGKKEEAAKAMESVVFPVDEKKDGQTPMDRAELAKEEFENSMRPKKARGMVDTSNLPKEKHDPPRKHEVVQNPGAAAVNVAAGFGKPSERR